MIFLDNIPAGFTGNPVLISGNESINYKNITYLYNREDEALYEIRHEYYVMPFSEAVKEGSVLAVGIYDHFYLFNISSNKSMLALKLNFYFNKLYWYNDDFFVTDACEMYRINTFGQVKWKSNTLGIDGVLIHKFNEGKIYGSGQIDPPDTWDEFILDINTGRIIT
jgi:hypothetical protein